MVRVKVRTLNVPPESTVIFLIEALRPRDTVAPETIIASSPGAGEAPPTHVEPVAQIPPVAVLVIVAPFTLLVSKRASSTISNKYIFLECSKFFIMRFGI